MDELERAYQQQIRDARHFKEWLDMGLDRGWVSDPFCAGHDDAPLTEYELRRIEEGDDPCVVFIRLLLFHDGPRYETTIDHSDETRPE